MAKRKYDYSGQRESIPVLAIMNSGSPYITDFETRIKEIHTFLLQLHHATRWNDESSKRYKADALKNLDHLLSQFASWPRATVDSTGITITESAESAESVISGNKQVTRETIHSIACTIVRRLCSMAEDGTIVRIAQCAHCGKWIFRSHLRGARAFCAAGRKQKRSCKRLWWKENWNQAGKPRIRDYPHEEEIRARLEFDRKHKIATAKGKG